MERLVGEDEQLKLEQVASGSVGRTKRCSPWSWRERVLGRFCRLFGLFGETLEKPLQ